MNTLELKITQRLFHVIEEDLSKPHQHAEERVGFLFCRASLDNRKLFATKYMPVHDDHYVPDSTVGAKINSLAIGLAIREAMKENYGVFHIHRHLHFGQPHFSKVDMKFYAEIMPCFATISPGISHGAIVLSNDSIRIRAWQPDKEIRLAQKFTVIGPLLHIWRLS